MTFCRLLLAAGLLPLLALLAAAQKPAATIGYLTLGGKLTGEDSAAVAWLKSEARFAPRILDLNGAALDHPGVDLLWIHIPDTAAYETWRPHLDRLRPLSAFYRGGGKLLLTGFAALVPSLLGIESAKPEIRPLKITNDWLFDQKGFQGFRGHPVYDGFFGGVFTWDTDVDHIAPPDRLFRRQIPERRPGGRDREILRGPGER